MSLDWMDHAACASIDNDLFFPEKGENSRQARDICRTCPVRLACLEYALAGDLRSGVFGGLTEQHRHGLRPGAGQRAIWSDNERHDEKEAKRATAAQVVADKKRARNRVAARDRRRDEAGKFLLEGPS